jgi:Fe2+ transport system protein B
MERLNDEGQWIVLMGFLVCIGIFFLAIIITQSTVVGQTTSEAVLEFPKTEIQDMRSEVMEIAKNWDETKPGHYQAGKKIALMDDLVTISMARKNAVVECSITPQAVSDAYNDYTRIVLHFNNGVTEYDETFLLSRPK